MAYRSEDPGPRELAIFCPACPQPGVNLPDDWKDDPKRFVCGPKVDAGADSPPSWVYMRGFVMDGNFSAEHMAMRKPDDDVFLSDGTAFMVGTKDYKAHLAQATEYKYVKKVSVTLIDAFCHWMVSRTPSAITTRPPARQMPIGINSRRPGSAQLHVLGTAASVLTLWWISKRASGR
jgi:hypothetical protein